MTTEVNYCAFIYGAHNQVTARRMLPTSQGQITLDHGVTAGVSEDLALELAEILSKSPIVPNEIVAATEGTPGTFSAHFAQEDAILCIKNIYAPAFVNQFCENERREDVLRAQTEQLKWIKRELERTRQGV
jgi:hypothetical protein